MENKFAELTSAGLLATIDFHEAQTRLAREAYIQQAETLEAAVRAFNERVEQILQHTDA